MKKIYVILSLIAVSIMFSYCKSSKKAMAAATPKSVYENDIRMLISGSCSPCHIPDKGGKKKAYDNYTNVKADIDEIIRRIELNPTDKGFMPMRSETKLSESAIAAFKKWKEDGMLEK